MSHNRLTSVALSDSNIKKKDVGKWELVKINKRKNLKEKEYDDMELELNIKYDPIKRFFSFMYTQIFVESLDFSGNEGLEESLAQFIIEQLPKFDMANDPKFKIDPVSG